MKLFKKTETAQETAERVLKLTDGKNYGIFAPPMNAQKAVIELCHFFLGDNWYTPNPVSQEQINTEIVYEIERKFKKFNKHAKTKRR